MMKAAKLMSLAALILLAAIASLPAQEITLKYTTAPVPIYKTDPEYTQQARDAKIQGSVILSVVIGVDGTLSEISVFRGLDPGLDAKAVECVQKWRFRPGMKDGEPAAVKAKIEVNFRLPQPPRQSK